MIRNLLMVCMIGVSAGAAVAASDPVIHQKGKLFGPDAATVKVGDELVFLNDDETTHNVMSTSAGNAFNLGALAPGESESVSFSKAGTVKVICAIHPKMKMTVKVEN